LKYGLTFLALSIASVVVGLSAWHTIGWVAAAFLYAAFTFTLLAAAYAGAGPRLLLKRRSGHQSVWGWPLFAPYFVLNTVIFRFYRQFSREPAFAQVAPNLFFGRRLSAQEAEAARWIGVLDLAGEFSEVRALRALPGYRSLPVLDATSPTEVQLQDAVAWLARAIESGPVYVHCALGHGRSASVVIAYLLSAGFVDTISEGAQRLRTLRSGVRLHAAQRRRLCAFERQPKIMAEPSAASDPPTDESNWHPYPDY
jgi:hypothetical protein